MGLTLGTIVFEAGTLLLFLRVRTPTWSVSLTSLGVERSQVISTLNGRIAVSSEQLLGMDQGLRVPTWFVNAISGCVKETHTHTPPLRRLFIQTLGR